MSNLKDSDFIGFSLDGIQLQEINILRTSDGQRYNEQLLPQFKDKIEDIPGGDGSYYWGSNFANRIFNISFAYDNLHEEDIRKLKTLLASNKLYPLVFDEHPEKKYMVKCTNQPELNYICFKGSEFEEDRIYKGEGKIDLIAYYPFAFGVDLVDERAYKEANEANISNIGDLPAFFEIYYKIENIKANELELKLLKDNEECENCTMIIKLEDKDYQDFYIYINSRTHLIEGLDENYNKTGNLYNKFIISGDFFSAPVGEYYFSSSINFDKLIYTPIYY